MVVVVWVVIGFYCVVVVVDDVGCGGGDVGVGSVVGVG